MKKSILLGLVISTSTAFAGIYTGNMVANPYFGTDANDYTQWTIDPNWRANGNARNLVYDFKLPVTGTGYSGYRSSFAETIDLTTVADIINDPDYDADTTKLTDLSFGEVYLTIPTWNTGMVGDLLDARFYIQANISTVSGNDYRAISSQVTIDYAGIVENGTLASGTQSFSINSWASYGSYDGNPFAGGDGIALSDIASIDYQWVMRTIHENEFSAGHPDYTDTGTFFFQADNAKLNYEVTAIPEPAVISLVALFGAGILLIRRRFMI
jgi:hypothetical protein